MTSDRKKQGVSAREAGRQLKVSHSYLLRLAGEKRLPRYEDGTFNVADCRDLLAKNTDAAQIRGPTSERWKQDGHSASTVVTSDQPAGNAQATDDPTLWSLALRAAEHVADPFEKGFVVAVVMLAHRIGAGVALLAADDAVPLPIAFGLPDLATLALIEIGEDAVRQLPSFAHLSKNAELPLRYQPSAFDEVAWDVVARDRGETVDVEAWSAQIRERRQQTAP